MDHRSAQFGLVTHSVDLILRMPPPPRRGSPAQDSVDEAARLMQLQQEAVRDVKRGEADPHGDGTFQPVHAQAFVQPPPDSFLRYDLAHRPENRGVGPPRHAGRLHAPPHHVQRVRGRLSDQARAGAEGQALVGIRLRSLRSL